MKKLQVKTKVYDMKTREYCSKWVEREISDELAEALKTEFSTDHKPIDVFGHGTDDRDIAALRTPLHDQNRFYLDCQFHVIDTDVTEGQEGMVNMHTLCGWQGF